MVEITYSYYTDEYRGSLVTEDEFSRLLTTAKIYVSNRTFGYADEVAEGDKYAYRVKHTVCSVIDILKTRTGDDGISRGTITSESVGGSWSRSYKVSDTQGTTMEDAIYDKIYQLLANTGLLYGGA